MRVSFIYSCMCFTSPCLMEMCTVLHKFNFSLFDGDVLCPTKVPLLSMEMCPFLHKFPFSLFDGDVPCPT